MVKFRQYIYPGDKGRDVKAVKHALWRFGHREINRKSKKAGEAFVRDLKTFQKNHGLHADGVYGPATHAKIAPEFTSYERWLYRTSKRRDPQRHKRARLVHWALWGVAHEPQIHYSMGADRGEWLYKAPGALPMTTDCSGWQTACYKWSNLPDPNALGYRVVGFTGTLLQGAHTILYGLRFAKPGDLIVVGPGEGDHVIMVIENSLRMRLTGNPLCVSHGREAGPQKYRALVDPRTPRRLCKYL